MMLPSYNYSSSAVLAVWSATRRAGSSKRESRSS